jgi:hypothetical protein
MTRPAPRPGYSPIRHLALTVGSGLAVLALAIWGIDRLMPLEWLIVPLVFVLSNAVEWRAHKGLLHRRRRPLEALYDQHTPNHHVAFRYDTMGVHDWKELELVLIPPFAVGLITLLVSPIALAVGWLISPNAGWLVLVSAALYVVVYELTHLSYHLPSSHPLGRTQLVTWLREHHRRHHDPRLMQRWNFNVTFPLWDVVRGTRISTARFEELTGRAAQTSRPVVTSDASAES